MVRKVLYLAILGLFITALPGGLRLGIATLDAMTPPAAQNTTNTSESSPESAEALGIKFVDGSTSTLVVQRNGQVYLVDLVARSVSLIRPSRQPVVPDPQPNRRGPEQGAMQPRGAAIFKRDCSACHGPSGQGIAAFHTPDFTSPPVQASLTDQQMLAIIQHGKPGTLMPAWKDKLSPADVNAVQAFVRSLGPAKQPNAGQASQIPAKSKPNVYTAGDDLLFTLPTGRPVARHGLYVNFAHRFPYFAAFSDAGSGGALGGLDSSALPSFGFRYGVTDRLSVSIYREPTLIARPIQLLGVYNFWEEESGNPFNFALGFAVQGQNDFSRNFTESLEGIVSKSLTSRAQIYLVPTLSFNNHPLQQVGTFLTSDILALPGYNTFSLGVGGALDIRPTVALVAEVIPTLVNGRPMGILRPAYSFGIQKKIWRHAFTFGFTNSPGITVAERAGTRASFLGQPNADTPAGLFMGFDLTRQLF